MSLPANMMLHFCTAPLIRRYTTTYNFDTSTFGIRLHQSSDLSLGFEGLASASKVLPLSLDHSASFNISRLKHYILMFGQLCYTTHCHVAYCNACHSRPSQSSWEYITSLHTTAGIWHVTSGREVSKRYKAVPDWCWATGNVHDPRCYCNTWDDDTLW